MINYNPKKDQYTYIYDPDTKELIEYYDTEYGAFNDLMIPEYGTQSIPMTPKTGLPDGHVSIYVKSTDSWRQVEDQRGRECFLKADKSPCINGRIHSIHPSMTELVPSADSEWNEELDMWTPVPALAKETKKMNALIAYSDIVSSGYKLLSLPLGHPLRGETMDRSVEDLMKLKAGYDLAELMQDKNMLIRTYDNKSFVVSLPDVLLTIKVLGRRAKLDLQVKWTSQDLID